MRPRVCMRMALAVFVLSILAGCSSSNQIKSVSDAAEVDVPTRMSFKLEELPAPKRPVGIAVYDIPDKTGKRKDNGSYPDDSAAVTQGAENYLIDALMRAGEGHWFKVYERAALSELLQEREIYDLALRRSNALKQIKALEEERQTIIENRDKNVAILNDPSVDSNVIGFNQRLEQQDSQILNQIRELQASLESALPPIQRAKYIVHGAITDYDTNMTTGGVGAKYLGIGGHIQYRKDIVTIVLRVSHVRSGETLLTTQITKTLYSSSIQGTVFKYVASDELFEFDAGTTKNEPGQFAIQEAVETGVYSLIMKGIEAGLWKAPRPTFHVKEASLEPLVAKG